MYSAWIRYILGWSEVVGKEQEEKIGFAWEDRLPSTLIAVLHFVLLFFTHSLRRKTIFCRCYRTPTIVVCVVSFFSLNNSYMTCWKSKSHRNEYVCHMPSTFKHMELHSCRESKSFDLCECWEKRYKRHAHHTYRTTKSSWEWWEMLEKATNDLIILLKPTSST